MGCGKDSEKLESKKEKTMALVETSENLHNHICDECDEIIEEGCSATCDPDEEELCAKCTGEEPETDIESPSDVDPGL